MAALLTFGFPKDYFQTESSLQGWRRPQGEGEPSSAIAPLRKFDFSLSLISPI
jgi:hypothetical protein